MKTYNNSFVTSTNEKIFSDSEVKVMIKTAVMSTKTGLSKDFLTSAFEHGPQNITDLDKIIDEFERRFKLSSYDNNIIDMYEFVYKYSSLSQSHLEAYKADDPSFYNNLTTREAITIILKRMLKGGSNIPSKNGYPAYFNFQKGQENRLLPLSNGKTWFPAPNKNNQNFSRLEKSVLDSLTDVDPYNNIILYHATSWNFYQKMMGSIITTNRVDEEGYVECTDFGKNNFYTTDTFYTACEWATRNNQGFIFVFVIPIDLIESLNVKYLYDTDEWRHTVFKARKEPIMGSTDNYDHDLIVYENEIAEHENFCKELDSYDLIVGPIMSNPGVQDVENVSFIVNRNRKIPHQYSFKPSAVDVLNGLVTATAVFFPEST